MPLYIELSLLLVAATAVSFVMRALKQPLVIGHIVTGLLVGPFLFGIISSSETWRLFSEIGISVLLFIVGLGLTPQVIREVGKISLITAVGQVIFTAVIGVIVSLLFGFDLTTSLYISVALAFSSTIIVLKLLSDKGEVDKLYAKIAIGFLLVQDLIAVALLFLIPLLSKSNASPLVAAGLFLKGIVLIALIYGAAHFILPRINDFVSNSRELLFLFSLAWGMGIAAIFNSLGFSLESGALIAGVSLSALPSRQEIASRLMPLRDFFIILFFIILGAGMAALDFSEMIYPIIAFSIIVLVGSPLITMLLMGFLGYRKKTGFQTGLAIAQISEFSLILVALGVSLGHLAPEIISLITAVGLLTIFASSYLMMYSEPIYKRLAKHFDVFELKSLQEPQAHKENYRGALFGYNRIGYDLLPALQSLGSPLLVVDHDPSASSFVRSQGADAILGDADDQDFLASLPIAGIEYAVSTIPELETNLLILHESRRKNPEAFVMAVAHRIEDALELYKAGASFVILPHFLGGKYAARLIGELRLNHESFAGIRADQLKELVSRRSAGQSYPATNRLHTLV